ncbi:MAG: phosphate signaling complex protein PhoU [Clostridiaceae bacterium]|nr:phosphate signaling complex protein PhoU [Clostridiaceae bacterium]
MSQRITYQQELQALHQRMIRMGSAVEEAIHMAILSLIDIDVEMAKKVIAKDDEIDDFERSITQDCIMLIARQQPVAKDLREITSDMKLITDLERMGDHAEDIAKHVLNISRSEKKITIPYDVIQLSNQTKAMIHAALDAYVSRDLEQAKSVILMDSKIDKLYQNMKKYLKKQMRLDPENVDPLVELLLISKHLERIGDHAENVAEWIVYYIEGEYATSSEIKKEIKQERKKQEQADQE